MIINGDIIMNIQAEILYTAENVTGFNYGTSGIMGVRHYSRDGEFLRRTFEEPKLHHYTKVGEVEITREDGEISRSDLNDIFHMYNTKYPSEITERIKSDELAVEHSSMSVGDVVKVHYDEDDVVYYIVANFGFDKIELK